MNSRYTFDTVELRQSESMMFGINGVYNFPRDGALVDFALSYPGDYGILTSYPSAICLHCVTVNYGEKSNCQNCGAPLPRCSYPSGVGHKIPDFLDRIRLLVNQMAQLIDDAPPFTHFDITAVASHVIFSHRLRFPIPLNENNVVQLQLFAKHPYEVKIAMTREMSLVPA